MRKWTRHVFMSGSVLVMSAALMACNPDVRQPSTDVAGTDMLATDARITAEVRAHYFGSDAVKAQNIDVETNDGVVTLQGSVPTSAAKTEAANLARRVSGVTDVRDELTIEETATATTETDEDNPNWITARVEAQYFRNETLKPSSIDVSTSNKGVVTLEGTVPSEAGRTEAVQIARSTDGVTDVRDELDVRMTNASGERASASASDAAQEVSETITDSWITAKIQSKYFLDPDVKGRHINVDTNDGVVTLRGNVGSYSERRQAASMARSADGVREVRDELRVSEERSTSSGVDDNWITTTIQSKLYGDNELRPSRIEVSTNDGVVTLEGTVTSADKKEAAGELAKDTDGVARVDNALTVDTAAAS